jgi:PAS domain S-box-containing protein
MVPVLGGAEVLRAASRPLRVVLADDSSSFRLLMQLTLEDHPSFQVVATAADGLEAVAMAEREQPDVVLLDIAMPRMDGLEAIPAIRAVAPRAKIVIFTGYSEARMGAAAEQAGADLFLEKAAPDERILSALLRLCGRPEHHLSPVPRDGHPHPQPPPSGSSDDYVDLLLDALEEGVLVIDAAGIVLSANFSATRLFGVPTSQLVGRHVSTLGLGLGDHRDSRREDPISAALAIGRPISAVDVSVTRPDGSGATLLASVRPMRKSHTAAPHAAVASFVDISRRRQAEEGARESARRFRRALDTMLDAVALYTAIRGPEGDIVDFLIHHANPAIEEVTGQQAQDLIGRQLLALFPALRGSPLFASYVGVVTTGNPLSVDSMDYRPYDDGHLNSGAYRVQACRMGDGLVVTWRLVGRRSTDQPVPLGPPSI